MTWAAPRTDVAMIRGGVAPVSNEIEVEYAMPIHVPMVDVRTVGAGGGSIARVDAGGMLRVGPESAGSTPGPICYGRGGTRVTISDANLILGRLPAEPLRPGGRGRAGRRWPTQIGGAARPCRSRTAAEAVIRHRQHPYGGGDPDGVDLARRRPARLRAVRLRRRGAAARGGAGARAGGPEGAGPRAAPASPMRWAAWWPTCGTTSCAR